MNSKTKKISKFIAIFSIAIMILSSMTIEIREVRADKPQNPLSGEKKTTLL